MEILANAMVMTTLQHINASGQQLYALNLNNVCQLNLKINLKVTKLYPCKMV